ncbi:hypothetical protein [Methylobacterium sp. Leaf113]|uniref:hypothetical protein n=1 Tax=Methylobacterium sp. Leaf113 TaxID=1736259 RepID=UPI0012E7663F|nr:hypothetical protein [Methylobacterium sp. Leaf113]
MQPFQAYRPTKGRSGAAMQADLDKKHQRDADSIEAQREIDSLKGLDRSLSERIEELEFEGVPARKILNRLAKQIARARQLAAALDAERKRNAVR